MRNEDKEISGYIIRFNEPDRNGNIYTKDTVIGEIPEGYYTTVDDIGIKINKK